MVVLGPNGQFRALGKPPFWPSFSTGALWFTLRVVCFVWRAASSGGLRDDTAAGMVERCQSDNDIRARKIFSVILAKVEVNGKF